MDRARRLGEDREAVETRSAQPPPGMMKTRGLARRHGNDLKRLYTQSVANHLTTSPDVPFNGVRPDELQRGLRSNRPPEA